MRRFGFHTVAVVMFIPPCRHCARANTFVQNVNPFTTNGTVTSTGNNAIIGTGALPSANGSIPLK